MRYLLHNHPAFPDLLTKDDICLLVERGSVARGDLCTDIHTSRDHTVGELINGMRPLRAKSLSRMDRPAFQEFRADDPHAFERSLPQQEKTDNEEGNENVEDCDRLTEGGELICYFSHPSWISYWRALLLSSLCLVAGGMLLGMEEAYALTSALCGIAVFIGVSIARSSHDYIVTEERVEYVWGILGRSSKEVRICDIRSLDVWEKGIKGLLGLGTLDVSSAGNAGVEVRFSDIRQAHKVKELIRQLQRGPGEQR